MKKRRRTIPLMFYVTPEERDQIEAKMAQLGTNNMSAYLRKIAIDGYGQDLKVGEIAEILGLSRFQVMYRVRGALRQLKKLLKEESP